MAKYILSDEQIHYLDAILPMFMFGKINDIRGSIERIVRMENADVSPEKIYTVKISICDFLHENGFGHYADYVFIIDKKGMELKNCGSLKAFEELHGKL